jgi:hypothetical protein
MLYVQGHLLNQRLGGPGRAHNLTPISRSANARHESEVESAVKDLVAGGAVLQYQVTVKYGTHNELDPAIKRLRTEISTLAAAGTVKNKSKIDDLQKRIEFMQYEQKNLCVSFKIKYAKLKKKGTKWVVAESPKTPTIKNVLPEE